LSLRAGLALLVELGVGEDDAFRETPDPQPITASAATPRHAACVRTPGNLIAAMLPRASPAEEAAETRKAAEAERELLRRLRDRTSDAHSAKPGESRRR
jgi:hypothetical protein